MEGCDDATCVVYSPLWLIRCGAGINIT
jgi:hypothetical protein